MEPRDLLLRLGDDEVLVLDCREDDEWDCYEVHIPGALRMTLSELSEASHSLPDDEVIVVCGTAPDLADERRAARLLRLRGRHAICLKGGLQAWISEGFPVERHAAEHRHRAAEASAAAFSKH